MFAYIATEADGGEGIPAFRLGATMFPMVGADMARMDSMRPQAELLAAMGMPIKLVKFTGLEVLEVFTPDAEEQTP
jgi:hypothetical protein